MPTSFKNLKEAFTLSPKLIAKLFFNNLNVFFNTNPIFPLLSNFENILGTNSL